MRQYAIPHDQRLDRDLPAIRGDQRPCDKARKSPAEEVDRSEASLVEFREVVVSLGIGPMTGEDIAAPAIDLDLPDGARFEGLLDAEF